MRKQGMEVETQDDARPKMIPTRNSLLIRLKDWNDQVSWRRFFDTYWKLIYMSGRKAGLTDAEAQDVVQDTIISVFKKIPSFEYNPLKGSFKGWLMTLTRWRIIDQLRKRQKSIYTACERDSASETSTIENIPDPAGSELEHSWNRQWESTLLEAAILRVKRKVDPDQFQIFELHVLREWSVSRVAKSLKVPSGRVYLVKHRINLLIKKEIKSLQKQPI